MKTFSLERFTQKLGPLPVWAWGLIGGVIVIAVYFFVTSRRGTTAVSEPVDDGGAAEAEENFQAAENAIGVQEDIGLWRQIEEYLKGFLTPAAPENGSDNAASAPPAPVYGGGGGDGWGAGGGSVAAPAPSTYDYVPPSNSKPIPDLAGRNLSDFVGNGVIANTPKLEVDWGATILGGLGSSAFYGSPLVIGSGLGSLGMLTGFAQPSVVYQTPKMSGKSPQLMTPQEKAAGSKITESPFASAPVTSGGGSSGGGKVAAPPPVPAAAAPKSIGKTPPKPPAKVAPPPPKSSGKAKAK